MFNAVNQFCQNYYDQIPTDGLKAAGLSAALSFTASVIYIGWQTPNQPVSFVRPMLAAGMTFIASAIHALTSPIFNYIFNNSRNEFNGFQELVRYVIDLTLAQILINHTTAFKVNLITSANLQGENFIPLPISLFKISMDIIARGISLIDPAIEQEIRREVGQKIFGMDFNSTSAIYVTP